jgi:cyanophycinase
MSRKARGQLLIIGGADRREASANIWKVVAKAAKSGSMLIVTAATNEPDGIGKEYSDIVKDFGVTKIDVLDIRLRQDAYDEDNVKKCKDASVFFLSGGDQLRLTSQFADTPVYRCMYDMYMGGCMIVGTSAGAVAMSETMIVDGPGDESNRVSALSMAPGLGLVRGMVLDSHFAQRGRIGRLRGAVVQNPAILGVGIDESTAILVECDQSFTVVGAGAVYVADGSTLTYSSLSEEVPEGIITIHDVKLHVLGEGDSYDLIQRRPILPKEIEKMVISR